MMTLTVEITEQVNHPEDELYAPERIEYGSCDDYNYRMYVFKHKIDAFIELKAEHEQINYENRWFVNLRITYQDFAYPDDELKDSKYKIVGWTYAKSYITDQDLFYCRENIEYIINLLERNIKDVKNA